MKMAACGKLLIFFQPLRLIPNVRLLLLRDLGLIVELWSIHVRATRRFSMIDMLEQMNIR